MTVSLRKTKFELVDSVGFNVEISTSTVGLHMVKTEYFYFNINPNGLDMLNVLCLAYILTCWANNRAQGQCPGVLPMCKK